MQFRKGYQIKPTMTNLQYIFYFQLSILKYFPSVGALCVTERRVERVNCEYLKREIFLSSPLENIWQTAGEKMFSFSQF